MNYLNLEKHSYSATTELTDECKNGCTIYLKRTVDEKTVSVNRYRL